MIPPELAELQKLMELPAGTRSIWADLADFQAFMSEFHSKLTDPVQRETMGKALDDLGKATAKARVMVPDILKELKTGAEQLQTEAQGLAEELERRKQELAEKKAEVERQKQQEATPPPPPSVESDLSMTMAAELLQMFGIVKQTGGEIDLQGSVASAWADPSGSDAAAKPPTKASGPKESKLDKKSVKKTPKSKDDIWEGLSMEE